MNKKNYLVLLLAVLPFFGWSQIKGARGTYRWPAYTPVTIPDSLKSEDAFFIDNVTTYDFREGFQTDIIVFKRTYINSESAAEELSQQELFVGTAGSMTILRARTLKASGEVLELDGDQIIETVAERKNKYGSESVRRIQFVFPNVEVGDVIDLVYEISLDRYIFSDLLYLEDDIPSMHSRITLRNFSLLDITAYRLNNAPPIESKMESGSQIIDWQKSGVKAMKTDYFNALPPDHPSLVFVLWRRGESLNYNTWFYLDGEELPQEYEPLSSINKMALEQGIIQEADHPFVQIQQFIRYMENECVWTTDQRIPFNKTLNSLTKQEVNQVLFFRYLMKFLKEKDIRYEKGFTKSLLNGRFEHGFVSLEQLTHRFLIIYDENDQPHYLFPPRAEGQFYYMDEIPYYLEGNQSIGLYGERDILKEQTMIALPESEGKFNMHAVQIKVKLNKGEEESSYTRKDRLSGHYSFLTRKRLGSIWREELGIAPDSVDLHPTPKNGLAVSPVYPYQIEYNQDEGKGSFYQAFDDSIGWLNVSSLLPLGVYQEDELDADFGDYLVLPFVKNHAISIFIQSDDQLSIAEEVRALEMTNGVGTIKMELFELNEKIIKAQLTIDISRRYLSGEEDVKQFKELLQHYAEIRSKKWLLKM